MPPSDLPIAPAIEGAQLVVAWFGYWPTFHDAEVVRLVLDRAGVGESDGPTLTLAIYAYEAGPEVEPSGRYVLSKECLVTFEFREVAQLELSEFNDQNALWELTIIDRSRDQLERVRYEVVLASSHGVGGRFGCHDVIVRSVEPYAAAADRGR